MIYVYSRQCGNVLLSGGFAEWLWKSEFSISSECVVHVEGLESYQGS